MEVGLSGLQRWEGSPAAAPCNGAAVPSLCEVFSNLDLPHQQHLVRLLGQRSALRLRAVCRQARDVVDSCMPEAYLLLIHSDDLVASSRGRQGTPPFTSLDSPPSSGAAAGSATSAAPGPPAAAAATAAAPTAGSLAAGAPGPSPSGASAGPSSLPTASERAAAACSREGEPDRWFTLWGPVWSARVEALLRQLHRWPSCTSLTLDSPLGGGPGGVRFLAPLIGAVSTTDDEELQRQGATRHGSVLAPPFTPQSVNRQEVAQGTPESCSAIPVGTAGPPQSPALASPRAELAVSASTPATPPVAPAAPAGPYGPFPQVTHLTLLVTRSDGFVMSTSAQLVLGLGEELRHHEPVPAVFTPPAAAAVARLFPNLRCLTLRGSWQPAAAAAAGLLGGGAAADAEPEGDWYAVLAPPRLPQLMSLELPGPLFRDAGLAQLTKLEHLSLSAVPRSLSRSGPSGGWAGLAALRRLRSLVLRVHWDQLVPGASMLRVLPPSLEQLAISFMPGEATARGMPRLLLDLSARMAELRPGGSPVTLAAAAGLASSLRALNEETYPTEQQRRVVEIRAAVVSAATFGSPEQVGVADWVARGWPTLVADTLVAEPSLEPEVFAGLLTDLLQVRRELVLRSDANNWLRPVGALPALHALGAGVPAERLAGLHLHVVQPSGWGTDAACSPQALAEALAGWPQLASVTVAFCRPAPANTSTLVLIEHLRVGLGKVALSGAWGDAGGGGAPGVAGAGVTGPAAALGPEQPGWCAVIMPGTGWSEAALQAAAGAVPGQHVVQVRRCDWGGRSMSCVGFSVVAVAGSKAHARAVARHVPLRYEG